MVRYRKRKTANGLFRENDMRAAVRLVLQGSSIRKVAREKNLAFGTLARYVRKAKQLGDNARMRPNYRCRMVFTEDQEKILADYILTSSKMCYGLSTAQCRRLAFEMAEKNNIGCPATWNERKIAGLDWFQAFMKRNPCLSIRTPEACSLSRATSFNKHNVSQFFRNLSTVFKRHSCFADGTRLFNIDETATTTVQSPEKVVAAKGVKQVSKCTSAERGTLVITCCIISAAGNTIPPVMVFPRVNFRLHMLNGSAPGTLGLAQPTGWMTSQLFVEVMKHFIKWTQSSLENPSLLLCDNHESHLSIQAIDLAKENGVTILTFPPHTTHKLQPLDVGIYQPFTAYYNKEVDNWMLRHPGKTMSIYDIAPCVNVAHQKAMTPTNIISAFRKTGIFPYDPDVFSDADYLSSFVTDRPLSTVTGPSNSACCMSDCSSASAGQNANPLPLDALESIPSDERNVRDAGFESSHAFRGFPKASARKNGRRKQGRTIIATDTPEKLQLMEKGMKRSKKTTSVKSFNKMSSSSLQSSRNQSLFNAEPSETSSGEEELSVQLEHDKISSEQENDVIRHCLSLNSEEVADPEVGDYVVVEFEALHRKNVFYYVGKVTKDFDEDGDFEVAFLRVSKKLSGKFVEPYVPDICTVTKRSITAILPRPTRCGTTSRQQSHYAFPVDFAGMDLR